MNPDILKVEGMHIRPVAAEVASRRKLIAALMLGGALLLALFVATAWKPKESEIATKDSAERSGYLVGWYGIPAFGILYLAFTGYKQLGRGRRAQRAAERALAQPNAVWMVSGLDVRPFNAPDADDAAFPITSVQRIELYRKPRVG